MRYAILIPVVLMLFVILIFVVVSMPSAEQQREIDRRACLASGRDTASCEQPTIGDGLRKFVDFYRDLKKFNHRHDAEQ